VALSVASQNILLNLLGDLYDAPTRQGFLEIIYHQLKDSLRLSPGAAFIPIDTQKGVYQMEGFAILPKSSQWLDEWLIYYVKLDPIARVFLNHSGNKPLRYTDFVPEKTHLDSPFRRDFLSKIPMTWVLVLPLQCFGVKFGMIWLMRQEAEGEFSSEDCELGAVVSHHASRAILLQEMRTHPKLGEGIGVLVFDGENVLNYQNEKAEQILKDRDAKWLSHPGNPSVNSLNNQTLQTEEGAFLYRILPVKKCDNGTYPVDGPSREKSDGKVVILEPYPAKTFLCQKMKELDLSKRQSQVVMEIVKGSTNHEIATKLGVTVQTVKDHLHDIFTLLHVRNRSELIVRVLGHLPPE